MGMDSSGWPSSCSYNVDVDSDELYCSSLPLSLVLRSSYGGKEEGI